MTEDTTPAERCPHCTATIGEHWVIRSGRRYLALCPANPKCTSEVFRRARK